MNKETIIGVVGSGAMGSGIAQVAATAGHSVLLYDTNNAQFDKAKKELASSLEKLSGKGKITAEKAEAIRNSIRFVESLSEMKPCGLVIEAIIEDLAVKQKLFTDLEKIVDAKTILASNTSSLSISSIAAACNDPSRVAGIHFFNPPTIMPLVEIIPGVNTLTSVIEDAKNIVDSWGKTTVVAKDSPGFIVNRVARSFYGESIRIAEEGIADYATIDWAIKEFGGFRMGPFELMDFIGNDVNYKVTETVWAQFFFEPRFKPSLTQKRLFESKMFGRKSGKGYYDYSPGAVMPEPKKDASLGKMIFDRVITMLINEAADTLYLRIATRDDIDTAMMKGVNYPKGLLKWADEIGIDVVYSQLRKLYDLYEEDRYRPCVLLKKMASEKKKFW